MNGHETPPRVGSDDNHITSGGARFPRFRTLFEQRLAQPPPCRESLHVRVDPENAQHGAL